MRIWRSFTFGVSVALACVGLGAVGGPVSAATVVEYPGPVCPDDATHDLQSCIDWVEAGSTIVLVSEIINEDAEITKDLTLKALDQSLQPLLDSLRIRTTEVDPLRVTVQDIRFSDLVQVRLSEGSGHDVRLRRLGVGKGSTGTRGLYVAAEVPGTVTVEGSYIRRSDGDSHSALNLTATGPGGHVHFKAIGNRISQHGNGDDSGGGIDLFMQGDGSVRADLMNNTIWDVGRCFCGAESGIAVDPQGPIQADVNIVGNTIELSRTNGIQQRNSLTGSGRLRLDVFNNIFSHHTVGAIDLDAGTGGSLAFRAGHNDYHANGESFFDGQSAGSGNRHVNPRFVDRAAGNLRLQSSSPLIDKGLVCSPGGIANLDAAGNGRLSGKTVDMGAYERGAGTPSGKALVGNGGDNTLEGTPGNDILCGYAGDDTLRGKGGRDWLDGGSDADRLTAGDGPDRSFGGGGKDILCSNDGVHGNDRADGGPGTDKGRTDSGDTRVSIESSASC